MIKNFYLKKAKYYKKNKKEEKKVGKILKRENDNIVIIPHLLMELYPIHQLKL